MALGRKLYSLRTSKNLTKEKLAEELGVSKTAYGKWENEITKPNFDNINLLCDYYKISKDELMEKENNVNQTNNTFNNSPNLINSQSPTINYTIPNEVIEKILENQKLISDFVVSQNELFAKIAKK